MKKKIFIGYCLLFCVAFFALMFTNGNIVGAGSTYQYYKFNVGDANYISLSDSQLETAYNNCKALENGNTISTKIEKTGDVHVFRFNQKGAFNTSAYLNNYAIYTTAQCSNGKYIGLRDTYMVIYRTYMKKRLLRKDIRVFEKVGISDDDCMIGDSNLGASFTVNKYLDDKINTYDIEYLVCVRGYGSKTGNYVLHIEQNEDKASMSYNNVHHWSRICEYNSAIEGITDKLYLNKMESIFYYKCLSPMFANNLTFNDYYKIYRSDINKARQLAAGIAGKVTGDVVTLMGIACPALGALNLCADILTNFSSDALSAIVSSTYEVLSDRDMKYRTMETIVNICDIKEVNSKEFYTINNKTYWRPAVEIGYGMVIVTENKFEFVVTKNEIVERSHLERYGLEDIITGARGAVGVWS